MTSFLKVTLIIYYIYMIIYITTLVILLRQAEDGVGIPEEVLDQPNFENSAKLYFLFIQFDVLWTLNYFALLVLNFFEVSDVLPFYYF